MKSKSIAIAVSIVALAVCGCKSGPNVSYGHITSDLTPEMKGLSERPTDDHTAYKMTSNQNMRSFWDDIGRIFLLDSPSRLSPMPVVSTSGQGR